MDLKAWAQMFFSDGSTSKPLHIHIDELIDSEEGPTQIAKKILQDLNRLEGLLVIWGSGYMINTYYKFKTSSPAE